MRGFGHGKVMGQLLVPVYLVAGAALLLFIALFGSF